MKNLGEIYQSENKIPEALKYYNKIIEIDPKNKFGLYFIGLCLQMQSDFEKAKDFYTQCLSIDKSNISAYHNMGNILYHEKKY